MSSNISKSNVKIIDIINNKLLKTVSNKKALESFTKHIDSIKGSITELKKFNVKVNQLSDKINTLAKLKNIDVKHRKNLRELKQISPPTFSYKKEVASSTHLFNLPVFECYHTLLMPWRYRT